MASRKDEGSPASRPAGRAVKGALRAVPPPRTVFVHGGEDHDFGVALRILPLVRKSAKA